MATVDVEGDTVTVRLSTAEKVASLRGDVRFPRSAVTGVEVVEDALGATRGMRAPGFALPGRRKIGTWRGRGKEFVSAAGGQRGVRITLEGQPWAAVVLGLDDPEGVAARLA